jgi:hypothetical protein
MAPEDVGKTMLVTKSGLFEWTVMPFGLKNATSTFARTMTEVFKNLGNSFLKICVNDLNVHSDHWQDHLQHLEAVLSRLRAVNLKLNPSKCCFVAGSVVFLGHVINKGLGLTLVKSMQCGDFRRLQQSSMSDPF